jgi:hypothetical protein
VGHLIEWPFLSAVPVVNLLIAIFDHGPDLFGGVFKHLDRFFEMPLLPDSDRWQKLREEQLRDAKPDS